MRELFESSFINAISEENDKLRQEIARLNKIIEEIENYCKLQIDYLFDLSKIPTLKEIAREHNTMLLNYRNILEKIQELKEEGKE